MKQPHLPAVFVNYNDHMDFPGSPVARIREFLGLPLGAELYRNRVKG
jgi:hypothetical protein